MRTRTLLLVALITLLGGTALYQHTKPLPDGVSVAWPERQLDDLQLLIDRSWVDSNGKRHQDDRIFDEVLRLIGQARQLIVIDMFLFNASGGDGLQPLSRQLTEALVARKAAQPQIHIVVISDPLNTLYGGRVSPWWEQLRAAGITVIETRLAPLRDSNPLWSAPWRLCCQWLGNSSAHGWLPSPLSDERVSLRSYLALLNFKANHRKTLVVDSGDRLRGLVSSANPHDGSSRHSNVAVAFSGPAAADLLASELAVAALSGQHLTLPSPDPGAADRSHSRPANTSGQIVSEGKIFTAAMGMIEGTHAGDQLNLAVFYLSHRDIIAALIRAHQRGVTVRVLLDANQDAFGRDKDGVPNRPAASDLHRAGIAVRWANTHGEQFHSKFLLRRDASNHWQLLLGSANFTRRNLNDYNLETNILLRGTKASPLHDDLIKYFDTTWRKGPDSAVTLSLPYPAWRDDSPLKYWRYRLMEASGLSTF